MLKLLREMTEANNLTDEQKAVVLEQLNAEEEAKKKAEADTKAKEGKDKSNRILEGLARLFGSNNVTETKEGDYEVDLDNLQLEGTEIKTSDVDKRVAELQDKINKLEKQRLDDRINKIAFDHIREAGYDPAKIATLINPADALKVEGNKIVGLQELMNKIENAGFQKNQTSDPFDVMKQDWVSDYQPKQEKSGLDSMMDDVFNGVLGKKDNGGK